MGNPLETYIMPSWRPDLMSAQKSLCGTDVAMSQVEPVACSEAKAIGR